MNSDLIGLALVAGMVAAFNPCGFAMLPAYLALVVNRDAGGQWVAVGRAAIATAAMTLGFLTVFGAFGALTVSVASVVSEYLPYVTLVVGIVLVALGLWLASGHELATPAVNTGTRLAPTAGLWSMFGYGMGYAIASLSCTVGPFLAVTGSSLRAGSWLGGFGVYAGYAAGFALVVGVLAIGVALASSALLARMRAVLPYVNRVAGLVMVAVGLYVAYYGWFEVRLLNSAGAVQDPVISAAGRLQGTLAGWVYRFGPLPWLVVSGAVAVTAVLITRMRRRLREGTPR